MTEQEWLTVAEPWGMIHCARGVASTRKIRLYTCACCRQALNPFAPRLAERAIDAAEAFADGEIRPETLGRVREVVGEAMEAARADSARTGTGYLSHLLDACLFACRPGDAAQAALEAALATVRAVADVPWPATSGARTPEFVAELASQADLLRDIFGNPFLSVEFQLEWFTSDVLALARGIYADRAFDRMPILADALQDAGCDDDDILNHCREPREHVRGCWVVDLLLGKK